jgi:hypothetical protein
MTTPAEQVRALAVDPQFARPGWDSYDAAPILQITLDWALAFAEALPEDCQAGGHVAPEAAGSILFSWQPGWLYVEVSVDSAGAYDWIATTDHSDNKPRVGVAQFTRGHTIPAELIAAIRKVNA